MKASPRSRLKNPATHLHAELKIKRGLLSREWVKVQILQFSAEGMLLRTDENLQVGGKAVISLKLPMDFGDIAINKVEINIKDRQKVCSCFDYEVEFNLGGSLLQSDRIRKDLKQIESLLSRYDSLINKIRNGPLSSNNPG
ncbi:hypothetical protein EUZ85_24880 [Hahella sp. KA22]|nr:hypothetical protein ENC22_22295 [Hahella sp. KA22]QAY57145.1 hypothetical protein EUZ85_24880 [Hahella sp. KA22]